MKFGKYWLAVIVIFVLCNCNMKAQVFHWAKSMSRGVIGRAISTDAIGNSYVTGIFVGTATFGSSQITSSGYEDIFIAKYDAIGNLLWVKKAGGKSDDGGYGISTDATGSCYIAGYFVGSATFGSTQITSSGQWDYDIFIAKYDAIGNFLWVQKAGGMSSDYGIGISTDATGNCYVTGYFRGTATFGSAEIRSSGDYDIFIAKYNANGNFLWVQNAGGISSDYGIGISTDAIGNCYVTGYFRGTATFGSTQITSSGDRDIFIAKYDANGNFQLVQKAGGTGWDEGRGISIDATGNCYVTGYFNGIATFGSTQITSSGDPWVDEIFIAKCNVSGDFLWVQKAGGISYDGGNCISTDIMGNCYVTGIFQDTATFGSTQITSSGDPDIFIAKYDATGNFLWVQNSGCAEADYGWGISTDASGNCYVTGSLEGTAAFGNITLNNGGFITKISASATGVDDANELPTDFSLAQNYPNPFNPSTVISYQIPVNSFVWLKVLDILGNEVATLVNEMQNSGTYNVTFDAGKLSSGVYLYQLRAGEFVSSKKLMLMK